MDICIMPPIICNIKFIEWSQIKCIEASTENHNESSFLYKTMCVCILNVRIADKKSKKRSISNCIQSKCRSLNWTYQK